MGRRSNEVHVARSSACCFVCIVLIVSRWLIDVFRSYVLWRNRWHCVAILPCMRGRAWYSDVSLTRGRQLGANLKRLGFASYVALESRFHPAKSRDAKTTQMQRGIKRPSLHVSY